METVKEVLAGIPKAYKIGSSLVLIVASLVALGAWVGSIPQEHQEITASLEALYDSVAIVHEEVHGAEQVLDIVNSKQDRILCVLQLEVGESALSCENREDD